MEDFTERISEKYIEEMKEVDCPFCGKAKINVTYIAGYMSWKTSRISAGSKRTPYYHDPKFKVYDKCPNCKASKESIKRALEKGSTKVISHEDRLKRLKEAGLPTRIEG